jgi:hypothetical protein
MAGVSVAAAEVVVASSREVVVVLLSIAGVVCCYYIDLVTPVLISLVMNSVGVSVHLLSCLIAYIRRLASSWIVD